MTNQTKIPDPEMDGKTHINIYTRGKTRLGRLLTNLSEIAVTHPVHGRFRTAEGFWYYLKTGCTHEFLRSTGAFESKKIGRDLQVVWRNTFREEFIEACKNKVETHAELKELLIESTLPFEHYYVYGGEGGKVHEPNDVRWLTHFWETYRTELKVEAMGA